MRRVEIFLKQNVLEMQQMDNAENNAFHVVNGLGKRCQYQRVVWFLSKFKFCGGRPTTVGDCADNIIVADFGV